MPSANPLLANSIYARVRDRPITYYSKNTADVDPWTDQLIAYVVLST